MDETEPAQPQSVSASGSPWQGEDPARRDRSSTARRAIGQSVVILLSGTLVAAAIGGWPVLAGAIEGDRPVAAKRGLKRVFRQREWAIGKEPSARERSVFGPKLRRGRPPSAILEQLLEDAEAHDGGLGWMGRAVRARGALELKEGPSQASPTVDRIDGSAHVIVIKDTGRWLMVAVRGEGRAIIGWTPRDTVSPLAD